ncbi:MAG TPA: formate dehydrogenase [Gammaproteobacteria bacterium]|nr:formate dehydrogenase [Gammaproteobacteria bacterium]HIG60692.1 formate dehydrogenase [Gammaproteobacteria bacterium]HIK69604.1 formate dehydrogenase [Pseudomonadales bacterium]
MTRPVKMINQIALNMSANGSHDEVALQVAQHLEKFWTGTMKTRVIKQCSIENTEFSLISRKALHYLEAMQKAKPS